MVGDAGQWYRTDGNEHWELDERGYMRWRYMSAKEMFPLTKTSGGFETYLPDGVVLDSFLSKGFAVSLLWRPGLVFGCVQN